MEVLISSLRKRSQFLRIAQKGRKFSSAGLILQMHKLDKVTDAKIQKGKKIIEVGYTASQKVGSATYRNKAKRRLRSIAMKVLLKHAKWGHEYVLIARRSTNSVDFDSLTRELEHCLKKLNAYRK